LTFWYNFNCCCNCNLFSKSFIYKVDVNKILKAQYKPYL